MEGHRKILIQYNGPFLERERELGYLEVHLDTVE